MSSSSTPSTPTTPPALDGLVSGAFKINEPERGVVRHVARSSVQGEKRRRAKEAERWRKRWELKLAGAEASIHVRR